MSGRGHETIDHTADMGIRGWGETIEEAFEEIAAAMLELVVERSGIVPTVDRALRRSGKDLTELLLEFLNALIAEADIGGLAFTEAAVREVAEDGRGWRVEATARGVPLEAARGSLLIEVKAATYYGASVRREPDGRWVAQCVVDL